MIHFLKTIYWNAYRDIKVDKDVIQFEVLTSDFLLIGVKSIRKPYLNILALLNTGENNEAYRQHCLPWQQ